MSQDKVEVKCVNGCGRTIVLTKEQTKLIIGTNGVICSRCLKVEVVQ